MSVTFDNILNFRDVGKTVNDYLGQKLLQEGVLYRSARPDDASAADRQKLRDELGIKTVLDLRTKTEHLHQAQKRGLTANAADSPVQIPDLRYREVIVTGRRFERRLLRQLSWWNYIKLLVLFFLGYRIQATSLMGRAVMQPMGLLGMALVAIDESGAEVAEALRTTLPPSYPPATLVHCTHGKDRTGIIIALILLALGVPTSAIAYDYQLSQAGLDAERPLRVREYREIGLPDHWADTVPGFAAKLEKHLDDRYGGIVGYLDSIGFGADERQRLVETLGA
ncbi:tyrosine/serine protein phosphatase [Hypoxylon fragiforme]|uniref:tyrosine/serine protein phosphatase n=1 Tax=Hypoxylon fragiforme TaxID=63214 RepID=UPI0020C6B235|nr:tyrosine/serine protein phosphatase [Hypoxylon fragiforme]KAI2608366.1 tyrosine/serine protein phosphatase [Hypoxylon fragiforme]